MKINTFKAFRSYNYRLYFTGQSISLIGTWMQKTAVSWVIYSQTNSNFMLGVTLFASLFPSFIFSFLGGIVSDRYNRYRVLLITQVASMIQASLVTALVFFDQNLVWELICLSAFLGFINAFDVPARQTLVYELVENKADLPNALALNSSMVNLSRLIGPGIAGFLLQSFGETVCFGLNALSFIPVLGSLLLMKLPVYVQRPITKNITSELREGFDYIKADQSIKFILIMLGCVSLFILPFSTLIPVYARDIFHGDASTFGVIDSAIGLGAFSGAIFLASLKAGRNLNKILAVNTLIFSAGLLLFSHVRSYELALVFATLMGFGMMSQITISNTLIQTIVAPAMRGRVISFYAMAFFGMQPLGGLLVGSVSHYIGVQKTMLGQGIIALLVGLVHFCFLKKSRLNKQAAQIAEKEVAESLIP